MNFADPYYVTDEDDPMVNLPHGYLTGDDVIFIFDILILRN